MSSYQYDPDLAADAAAAPDLDLRDVAAARRQALEAWTDASRSGPEVAALLASDGERTVQARLHRPPSARAPSPAILYLHGGGFVVGPTPGVDSYCGWLAHKTNAVVIAAHYALAPEDPFPSGLLDCWTALRWLAANAPRLGIDANYLALDGDSAGGCLAIGTALMARDFDGPSVRLVSASMPVLDDRLDTPSMRQFADTPLWNNANAALSWNYYLSGGVDLLGRDGHGYAAPARAPMLDGLPPVHLCVAQFDPCRDEALLFGTHLVQSGVPTEIHHYPGTFHGSQAFRAPISRRMRLDRVAALGRAFAAG